ncbi:MAG: NADH-quinone oxidoreductase subunit NuoN [gamma proteobacterium symbiont of Bathyaustriella thionipta]|nr:NADH-quinone oxidoreductase subunit NuoN [gamma proteobacterium symbiont of Bathyaustriella thionipta]
MSFDHTMLYLTAPEITLALLASAVLLLDSFLKPSQRVLTYIATLLSLLIVFMVTFATHVDSSLMAFDGQYIRDPMSDVLKLSLFVLMAFVFVYAKDDLRRRGSERGEFYALGLFALLGMMIMISAASFLSLYLGLELLALCLYALVAFQRNSASGSEAAMKYFVLGALASGLLLYGISMVYGATGQLGFAAIAERLQQGQVDAVVMSFGLVFVVLGLAFKLGAVPFHMWVPDVYQGAPTSVTALIGSAPKVAAFAMAMRILVDALPSMQEQWQLMLIILAVLSLAVGNIVAIAQTNIKRMLAYSTISHVGFILLGLIAGTTVGYASAMFYALVYALTALGGFGLLMFISRQGFDAENLHDLKGLNERSPWYALMMMLVLFSMAGVPPTVGFFAKLAVLDAIIRVDLLWLAITAVIFSVIGAFYYLRVIKMMYFDKAECSEPLQASTDTRFALSLNGLAMIGLGIMPSALMSVCASVFA